MATTTIIEGNLQSGTAVGDADDVKGEAKGQRATVGPISVAAGISADAFMSMNGVTGSATIGMIMPRAGSVVGIGYSFNASAVTTVGGNPSVAFRVVKNGTGNVSITKTTTVSSTGDKKDSVTQVRNAAAAAQFVANDVLAIHLDFTIPVGSALTIQNIVVFVELQFDT